MLLESVAREYPRTACGSLDARRPVAAARTRRAALRRSIKAEPEDFRVEEELSFLPSGDGPHRLLRVEKRSANTRWVAAELARIAEVAVAEVGYAGLKDRHAIGVQWFSLPAARGSAEFWSTVHKDEFRVLESQLNTRKLRRGALRGNRFRIKLRQVDLAARRPRREA